jgi:hypothetical protein
VKANNNDGPSEPAEQRVFDAVCACCGRDVTEALVDVWYVPASKTPPELRLQSPRDDLDIHVMCERCWPPRDR